MDYASMVIRIITHCYVKKPVIHRLFFSQLFLIYLNCKMMHTLYLHICLSTKFNLECSLKLQHVLLQLIIKSNGGVSKICRAISF